MLRSSSSESSDWNLSESNRACGCKPSILIVDDTPFNVLTLQTLISNLPFNKALIARCKVREDAESIAGIQIRQRSGSDGSSSLSQSVSLSIEGSQEFSGIGSSLN